MDANKIVECIENHPKYKIVLEILRKLEAHVEYHMQSSEHVQIQCIMFIAKFKNGEKIRDHDVLIRIPCCGDKGTIIVAERSLTPEDFVIISFPFSMIFVMSDLDFEKTKPIEIYNVSRSRPLTPSDKSLFSAYPPNYATVGKQTFKIDDILSGGPSITDYLDNLIHDFSSLLHALLC
jgi:hypothetical protein